MSHQADEEFVLRTLAEEGGRLKFTLLTWDGILAANRLARADRVYIDKGAEGWDLALVQQEPGS